MALKISPSSKLPDLALGEEVSWTLTTTAELKTKTVASHTFKIYDSAGTEVTSTFGGDSSESSGIISYGIKAAAIGTYTIKFVVTCNEVLPDGVTPYEFNVELSVVIN